MLAGLTRTASPQVHKSGPADGLKKDDGWRASLKLEYAANHGKSVLLQQERQGPLFVQKPLYPEGPGTCHTYIIHPPGGVVGGDKIYLDLTLGAGSQALITTPAAGKFYRSAGPEAVQISRLDVAAGAVLEWLPQETIIFNGARAAMRTTVRLEAGAGFIGWEMICLGLPACAEPFRRGRIDQHLEVWLAGQPVLIEPLRVGSNDPLLAAPWGMAGHPVIGTLAATVQDPLVVDAIRVIASAGSDEGLFSVSRVHGLTLCRFLGDDVYAGLKLFRRAWEVLRPAVKGCVACPPRIWAT
jgi:urease accessory protein